MISKADDWTPQEFRALRKRMGATVKELAFYLGVAPVTIYRWETGETPMPKILRLLLVRMAKDYD